MSAEGYFTSDRTETCIKLMKAQISDADKCLSDLVRISSYIVSKICAKQIMEDSASIDLSDNQFYILKILSNESPFNLSNLANILLISNAAVGKMIDKLVCKKLVRRRFSKKDRRTAMVSITTEGQKIVKKYNNLILEKQIENFEKFTTDEKESFKNYLKLFVRYCMEEDMDTNILCYQCNGLNNENCVVEEKKGFCLRKKTGLINGN